MSKRLIIFALLVLPSTTLAAEIDAARLSEHVRVLASDEMQGRAPDSAGGRKAVEYIVKAFTDAGLQPGGLHGDWLQRVPAHRFSLAGPVTASARIGKRLGHFEQGGSIILYSQKLGDHVSVVDAPLVFAGYGITAPELGWDDLKGASLQGKVAIVLLGDPDRVQHDASAAKYGNFRNKLKNLAAHGARGVLWVYDAAATGWLWPTAQSSYAQPQFTLDDEPQPELDFEGWLSAPAAQQLFAMGGQNLASLASAANRTEAQPLTLAATFSADFRYTREAASPPNVIGLLPGARRPNEDVIYTAHWDHLGRTENGLIYSGAIDNASGVAAVIEIARSIAAGPRPARSIVFMATTLEEQGLLGARYYVRHPVYPLATTVADLNLDAVLPLGRARDVVIMGAGLNDLDRLVEHAAWARRMKAVLPDDPDAYYRADNYAFAEAGVPSAFLQAGTDLLAGGTETGRAAEFEFVAQRYHQTADKWSPNMDFQGIADVANLYAKVGRDLANSSFWPQWHNGVEFRSVRTTTAASRS